MTRPAPPSGTPPPLEARLGDLTLDLRALAQEICRRYREEYPDEEERYGDVGVAWCVHDNQHILNWGVAELEGWVRLDAQIDWLARVLAARGFPLERLARDLEIAAEVVRAELGAPGGALAELLARAARTVEA